MCDRADEAREATSLVRREVDELHTGTELLASMVGYGMVLTGDLDVAEAVIRSGVESLSAMGEVGWLSTLLPDLGWIRMRQGDDDEARRCRAGARYRTRVRH